MVQKKSIKKAIILAGGRGERLKPLTDKLPKILLPLGNRPFCFYQIEWLRKYGIKEIIFALGYLADKVKEVFFIEKNVNLSIDYVIENSYLDTAGAIKNVFNNKNIEEPCIVLNGDILTNINLFKIINFHYKKKSLLTLTLIKKRNPSSSYGIIKLKEDGKILEFSEKLKTTSTSLINAGIYIFQPEILTYIPNCYKYSLEKELIPNLIQKRKNIFGLVISGYWLDIGTHYRYSQAQRDIKSKKYIL
jgi:NDP-sugar pyrophosphorylase family protein